MNASAKAIAAVLLTLLAGACAAPPTKTTNPLFVPENRKDIVSVCYSAGTNKRDEIEAVAMKACPKGTVGVRPWKVDKFLNDCPMLKKTRVSFVCVPGIGTH